MQIILSQEEVEVIYESLLTHIIALNKTHVTTKTKGMGDIEVKYLRRSEALRDRFNPYMKKGS